MTDTTTEPDHDPDSDLPAEGAPIPTTIADYKALVRRVGVAAALRKSWCNAGTNTVLAEIGVQGFDTTDTVTLTARLTAVNGSPSSARVFADPDLLRAAVDQLIDAGRRYGHLTGDVAVTHPETGAHKTATSIEQPNGDTVDENIKSVHKTTVVITFTMPITVDLTAADGQRLRTADRAAILNQVENRIGYQLFSGSYDGTPMSLEITSIDSHTVADMSAHLTPDPPGETLDDYKERVRACALDVHDRGRWTDDELDDVLRRLGL